MWAVPVGLVLTSPTHIPVDSSTSVRMWAFPVGWVGWAPMSASSKHCLHFVAASSIAPFYVAASSSKHSIALRLLLQPAASRLDVGHSSIGIAPFVAFCLL